MHFVICFAFFVTRRSSADTQPQRRFQASIRPTNYKRFSAAGTIEADAGCPSSRAITPLPKTFPSTSTPWLLTCVMPIIPPVWGVKWPGAGRGCWRSDFCVQKNVLPMIETLVAGSLSVPKRSPSLCRA